MANDFDTYLNSLIADVEWQNGLAPWQYDVCAQFANRWMHEARANGDDLEQAYTQVRETLRNLANRIGKKENPLTRAGYVH